MRLFGTAPLPPPVTLSGTLSLQPIVLEGTAAAPPLVTLFGTTATWQGAHRRYDWALALIVYIGTWGQEYFQQQTPQKTQETFQEWRERVRQERAVALEEFKRAWKHPLGALRPFDPRTDPERLHVRAFQEVVRTQCDLDRLMGISPPTAPRKDPPVWDYILRFYLSCAVGAAARGSPLEPDKPRLRLPPQPITQVANVPSRASTLYFRETTRDACCQEDPSIVTLAECTIFKATLHRD